MAAVVVGCRKSLVNARWTIVLLSCTNGPRKPFSIVGAPYFSHFRQLSVRRSASWSEDPEHSLMSGCDQGYELVKDMLKELWLKFAELTHSRSRNTGERMCD